jgi:hypothetical protein
VSDFWFVVSICGNVVFKVGDDGAAIHLVSIEVDARMEWIFKESPGWFFCADVEFVRDEDGFEGKQKQCVIEENKIGLFKLKDY